MEKFSLTQTGNIVALVSFLLKLFNVNIATEEVTSFVTAGGVIVGLAVSWYGRYKIGDLKLSGFRK